METDVRAVKDNARSNPGSILVVPTELAPLVAGVKNAVIVLSEGSAAGSCGPSQMPDLTVEHLEIPVHRDALRLCLKVCGSVGSERALKKQVAEAESAINDLENEKTDLLWKHLLKARFTSIPAIDKSKVANESDGGVHAYIFDQFLGQGAFGNVRVGRRRAAPSANGSGESKVAIKIIDKSRVCCVDSLEMVDREISLLIKLKHINIIRLVEVVHSPSRLYIVTEYVPTELKSYLEQREGSSDPSTVISIVSQLVSALSFIHGHQICHRDLKPANILLGEDKAAKGWLKLIDFGLSARFRRGEKLRRVCGSPGYLAPEVLLGEGYDGALADAFSLGIVILEVCSAMPVSEIGALVDAEDFAIEVHDRKNLANAVTQIVSSPSCAAINPGCRELVKSLLDFNPNARASVGSLTRHPWLEPMSPASPGGRPKRRTSTGHVNGSGLLQAQSISRSSSQRSLHASSPSPELVAEGAAGADSEGGSQKSGADGGHHGAAPRVSRLLARRMSAPSLDVNLSTSGMASRGSITKISIVTDKAQSAKLPPIG